MNIAIIGTGNVGGALARNWSRAGHTIFLGVRDQNAFKNPELLEEKNTSLHSIKDAVKQADVILVAAVPQAVIDIAESMGDVSGKLIIDAMNSVRIKPEGYENTFEAFKALRPEAELVKCFNSTGFENMQNPVYHGQGIDMFVAGSSITGKETARKLALEAGFENCYDFGGDDKAALLEQFALSWINLAIMQGHGRDIAFKLIRR
jgi:hypothetical protein